jgi:hypothetical protein
LGAGAFWDVIAAMGGPMLGPKEAESRDLFQGSVQQWVDQLAGVVERFGMNGFVYWPNDWVCRTVGICVPGN